MDQLSLNYSCGFDALLLLLDPCALVVHRIARASGGIDTS
jgi:hypothetical protein